MKSKIKLFFSLIIIVLLAISRMTCESPHYLKFQNTAELQEYLRWSADKPPIISAHRGGPMPGFPENCIETFENSLNYAPCIIECDVARTRDSVLVMMHDYTLDRTTTGSGKISDFSLAELKELYLKDNNGNITRYKIPTLAEVLDWGRNRAIIELDIKGSISAEEIVNMINAKNAVGYTIVITYDLPDAVEYHELNSDLVISATARSVEGVQRLLETGIDPKCLVAFAGVHEPEPAVYDLLHQKEIMAILGTMGNLDRKAEKKGFGVYQDLVNNGADILATDNVVLASKILEK
ncbi:MAG: glycerophosphodiester phosphodiesterase family protein [Fidelibacterota bacterium]